MKKLDRKKTKFVLWLVAVVLLVGFIYEVSGYNWQILNTKGDIGDRQREIIYFTMALSLVVIIPVYFMLYKFIDKYRDDKPENKQSDYRPDWDSNKVIEIIWWGVPILLIGILSVVTYKTSHSLDPYRSLDHAKKPLTVQVMSLQYKWLFIYPEQGVASVNYLKIPVDRPIDFKLASDAPMNSFWIPQLGGQIYTMSGMVTELSLIADEPGDYKGVSSNLSGEFFGKMRFTASAVSDEKFHDWVMDAKMSGNPLSQNVYDQLKMPSYDMEPTSYYLADATIFSDNVFKYMHHGGHSSAGNNDTYDLLPDDTMMHKMEDM